MRQRTGLILLICALATPVLAEAPEKSLRPMPRPVVKQTETGAEVLAQANVLRPMPRPVALSAPTPELPISVLQAGFVASPRPPTGVVGKLRPLPRPETAPDGAEEVQPAAAIRVLPGKSAVFGRKGSVCGVNGIKGETIAPITSRVKGCGVPEAVRVTSVDGVSLSTPATINCETARALNDWVRGALKPAFGRTDVIGLQVAASYACRPRNNVKGAPISEHGRGKAIDISAIVLEGGKTITVLDDWRSRAGKPMVKAYRTACGTFGTTLGPESDRYHRNHMHFDTARQRNGPYCR